MVTLKVNIGDAELSCGLEKLKLGISCPNMCYFVENDIIVLDSVFHPSQKFRRILIKLFLIYISDKRIFIHLLIELINYWLLKINDFLNYCIDIIYCLSVRHTSRIYCRKVLSTSQSTFGSLLFVTTFLYFVSPYFCISIA